MNSIQSNFLEVLLLKGATVHRIGRLYYQAGKQLVAAGASKDLFEEMRQDVITQGTRSSNGIEGIVVEDERYLSLMNNKVAPSERNEKLVVSYRDALAFVHREHEHIEFTPETIKDFHRRIYAQTGEVAGEFREEDNKIVREEGGVATIVFTPPPHRMVKQQIEKLCSEYQRLHGVPTTDEFLLMAGVILDFTCIHPFADGNGRVSRLLTTLLAYKAGFEVVRYISHEKIVGDTKSAYYYALTESSRDWQRSAHRWSPWIDYLANTFVTAYEQLHERLNDMGQGKGYQGRRIREVVADLPSQFRIRQIFDALPKATRPTVTRVLSEMKAEGLIETVGAGPNAYYRKVSVLDRKSSEASAQP